MKIVSAQTMRELDSRTIRSGILSGTELMYRAAYAVFRTVEKYFPDGPVVILAGKGNNGGDGFITASLLHEQGREVRLFTHADEMSLKGDALAAFLSLPDDLRRTARKECTAGDLAGSGVIVDAMLGTGFQGEVRAPFDSWIPLVNQSGAPVLAVDLPSGLNADTGEASLAVQADVTVTFALPKTGMLQREGPRLCGRILPADIGIPREFTEEAPGMGEVTAECDVKDCFQREPFDTYKNARGHLFVIGGSQAYAGAPFLTGEAALRSGAGLVTVLVPDCIASHFSIPKALIVRHLASKNGVFSPFAAEGLWKDFPRVNAAVIGPGLSSDPDLDPFLDFLLRKIRVPVLLDADALNRIAAEPHLLEAVRSRPRGMTVLTPHEGEMRRLEEACSLSGEGKTKEERARALALHTGTVCVLKGPHSAVASENGDTALNLSGCSVLATAGSGDVLSGVIGACLMRDPSVYHAVRTGVFLHGRAGEKAAGPPRSGRGILADDLPGLIPDVMAEISYFA